LRFIELAQEALDHGGRLVGLLELRKIPCVIDRHALQMLVRGNQCLGGGGVGEARVIPEDEQGRVCTRTRSVRRGASVR